MIEWELENEEWGWLQGRICIISANFVLKCHGRDRTILIIRIFLPRSWVSRNRKMGLSSWVRSRGGGGGTTPLCIPMGCNDGEMTIEEFRKQQSWQASESCYLCLFWFPRTISDTSLLFSFMLLLLLLLDNCRRRTFRKDETLFSISRWECLNIKGYLNEICALCHLKAIVYDIWRGRFF